MKQCDNVTIRNQQESPILNRINKLLLTFLFLSFRRVLNVIYSFLGNSPASEF